MFKLLSIQQTINASPDFPGGEFVRCTIMADNTTDPLPTTGSKIEGLQENQTVTTGSVCITPAGDIAIMGNTGEWGDWT